MNALTVGKPKARIRASFLLGASLALAGGCGFYRGFFNNFTTVPAGSGPRTVHDAARHWILALSARDPAPLQGYFFSGREAYFRACRIIPDAGGPARLLLVLELKSPPQSCVIGPRDRLALQGENDATLLLAPDGRSQADPDDPSRSTATYPLSARDLVFLKDHRDDPFKVSIGSGQCDALMGTLDAAELVDFLTGSD